MIGLARNLVEAVRGEGLPHASLVGTYLRLRAQRAAGATPPTVRILDMRVAYVELDALVTQFEEIFLRRHYPFRPRRQQPLVVDAGANIGVATLFLKALALDARVVAFEPEPTAFALLEENVRRNGLTDVELVRAAVAGDAGHGSLRAPRPGEGGASLVFAASDWAETPVETVRLSERLPEGPVDFLKLDVEGTELVVLSELEASGALARIEQVALEVHPVGPEHLPAVLDVLVRAGFRHRVAVVNDRFWDDSQLLLVDAFRN